MDDNRKKALSAALGQIERQFGKGSVMRLGDSGVIKDIDVNVAVDQHVYLTGNTANVQFDVEAVGNNTLAEFDVAVLVTDGFSSITGSAFAAVA